jgi:hypothetical protein
MVWAFIVASGGFLGALKLWWVLRFLRHAYDKRGTDDLLVVASAIRTARWPLLSRTAAHDNSPPTVVLRLPWASLISAVDMMKGRTVPLSDENPDQHN